MAAPWWDRKEARAPAVPLAGRPCRPPALRWAVTSSCLSCTTPGGSPCRWVTHGPRDRRLSKTFFVVCVLLPPTCQGDPPGSSPQCPEPPGPLAGTQMEARTFGSAPPPPFPPVPARLHSACLSADH
ncbi:hypothetical protein HJG60_010751 [Phyllostomus discolor]|uniref:Uncharacterized protein n=1 Tax=Phyllostomus discolor TaxID=89673 RepID=A0A834EA85_9CHIR|nr:hypothetical protein HJG60_010751 [Phyllostomus discolor]